MKRLFKRAMSHGFLIVGLSILLCLFFVAIVGPFLVDKKGLTADITHHLASPQEVGSLGRGVNGIDVLTWLIYGTRISLFVSFLVTAVSMFIGIFVGACAGYFGGRLDAFLMRFVDIILAFPGLLLALYLATVFPPTIFNLVIALSATGWVAYARLVRARVMEIKAREYILAALALGIPTPRLLLVHIMPNVMGPIIVQASYGLSVIILAEAGLSFLGLGVPIGTPSWGALLDQGVANLFLAPHLAIFPGLCIAITVLCFNFLGDGLRDILDPKSSEQT